MYDKRVGHIEIFKDIPKYEGLYQISNLGTVKSLKRKVKYQHSFKNISAKILKQSVGGSGYLQVGLSKNGKVKSLSVHILVAITFLNHTSTYHNIEVDHKDENRLNNSVLNLQLLSNRQHKVKNKEFPGTCFHIRINKWGSKIFHSGRAFHLGYFNTQLEAHQVYLNALSNV